MDIHTDLIKRIGRVNVPTHRVRDGVFKGWHKKFFIEIDSQTHYISESTYKKLLDICKDKLNGCDKNKVYANKDGVVKQAVNVCCRVK